MSIISNLEKKLQSIIAEAGYDIKEFHLSPSVRPDLGDYQINDAMTLAKKNNENPHEIAQKIVDILNKQDEFKEVTIAGPGFINIKVTDKFLYENLNLINTDIYNNIDKKSSKKIIIDYGGANIAKTLHVGHLRSANIGEAVKRLARLLGYEVISDVHFGDIGRQSGMVISEIKYRYPDLAFFDENFTGDYSKIGFKITPEELGEIYPKASLKAKEDPEKMAEVVQITKELEEGNKAYQALWNIIKKTSIEDIKKIYDKLDTHFDLLEGETDCYPYIDETIAIMDKSNKLVESEGAKIINVAMKNEEKPMPPLVVIKSNNATLYATRELATIYSRVKRFTPDEIWYFTDNRQALYFEQVFRAVRLTNLIDEKIKLEFYGFGAMTGEDGKPFKTRDGDVMPLNDLIDEVNGEVKKRINTNIVEQDKIEEVSNAIAIAAIKYADILPFRSKDYVFDPIKFSDLDGKTGPYILYSTIRMKSLLEKAEYKNTQKITKLKGTIDKEIALTILRLPKVLTKSLEIKSLNEIAEYIYKLTSLYNSFYSENRIIPEEDIDLKSSWLELTNIVYTTNTMLLDILGIKIPEKM